MHLRTSVLLAAPLEIEGHKFESYYEDEEQREEEGKDA